MYLEKDKQGKNLVFNWFQTRFVAEDFAAALGETWRFSCAAYTPVEMDFLKAFPEVVHDDPYLQSLEPLFEKGIAQVDWEKATVTMQSILKHHFVFNPKDFPQSVIKACEQDRYFFVSVKYENTNDIIGFIVFSMRENYPRGTVKVMYFAVDVAYQNKGIGKLLMHAITRILPEVERVFLCTRITNKNALAAYQSWGFSNDSHPIMDHPFNLRHWQFMTKAF